MSNTVTLLSVVICKIVHQMRMLSLQYIFIINVIHFIQSSCQKTLMDIGHSRYLSSKLWWQECLSLAYFDSLLLLAKKDGSQIPVIFARHARRPEQKDIPSFRHPAAAKAGAESEPFREQLLCISKNSRTSMRMVRAPY